MSGKPARGRLLGGDIAGHWYFVSKGRALRRMLRQICVDDTLDVGAGSGIFSRQLLDAGICRRAVCVDPSYRREREEEHNHHEIAFVRSVSDVTQKLVLMMDVLEHVDDDVGLLQQYTKEMPSDGYVLITVPAFQFLWSGHDVFLKHRRRYTRKRLEKVVRAANLRVVKTRFFFATLLPIVAVMRIFDRARLARGRSVAKSAQRKHSLAVNTALRLVHDIERTLLFPFNRFAGLTILCLARPRA